MYNIGKVCVQVITAICLTMLMYTVSPIMKAQASEMYECGVTENQACLKQLDKSDTLRAHYDLELDKIRVSYINDSDRFNALMSVQFHPSVEITVRDTETLHYNVDPPRSMTYTNISLSDAPVTVFIEGFNVDPISTVPVGSPEL